MNNICKQNTLPSLFTSSKEFNREFICRVDGEIGGITLHTAVGFTLMLDILGPTAKQVGRRLENCKAQKLTVKPYHGLVITYYRH